MNEENKTSEPGEIMENLSDEDAIQLLQEDEQQRLANLRQDEESFFETGISMLLSTLALLFVLCFYAFANNVTNVNLVPAFVILYPILLLVVYYYAVVFGTITHYVYRFDVNAWYVMNLICLSSIILYIIAACVEPLVVVPYEDMPKAAFDAMRLKFSLIMLGAAFIVYSGVFGTCLYDDQRKVIGLLKGALLTLLSFLLNIVVIGGIAALVYIFLM